MKIRPCLKPACIVLLCITAVSCAVDKKQYEALHNPANTAANDEFDVQLLGINDFHGQIKALEERGGMYQLSRHLLHAIATSPEPSFILHAGDHVGASPAESALLQDEPSIDFLNILGQYCLGLSNNACHVIGAAGNHEFDEGSDEMLRLLNGGNHANGPFLQRQWQGANYVTLSANVVDKDNQNLLLPAYVVHYVNEVPIGFIGITLDTTPDMVIPGMVDNLVFEDQANIVTKYAAELTAKGINAIVVIVHDGSKDVFYAGDTSTSAGIEMDSKFGRFITRLPDEVDVLVTGHSHRFTNAYVSNQNAKTFLVTQAFSSGIAYSDITITLSKQSNDIVKSSASVIMTNIDTELELDDKSAKTLNAIKRLEQSAVHFAKGITSQVIGTYMPSQQDMSLGQFIADSHLYSVAADMAVMNNGGVRASLPSGPVTWGDLFSIQPFGNALIKREYTGQQLQVLIDEDHFWSSNVARNKHGRLILNGKPIIDTLSYSVTGNAYILNTDGFAKGKLLGTFGQDIEATVDYIKSLSQPFSLQVRPD